MSIELLSLPDRIITDAGEVILRPYPHLERAMLDGVPLAGMKTIRNSAVDRFIMMNPDTGLEVWEPGELIGPDLATFAWQIPSEYQEIDLVDHLVGLYQKRFPDDSGVYYERLAVELEEIAKRDMEPFVRCLIYIVDEFRKRKVVWGVGRGSSCASLVMFLIGVNRVDPVLYEIPLSEFLKP